MSGARPKVYTPRRSSRSSSDEETGALCRQSDSGELAVSSRDAQEHQDDVQLSLACQQLGTVRRNNCQVDGRDNVLLQQGDNCKMTINSPLVNVQKITQVCANGTEVRCDDGEDSPRRQTHPDTAAIGRLDDLANLTIRQTRHPSTRVRRPQLPSTEQLEWLKCHLKRLYRTNVGEFQPLPWFDDLHLQLKDVYTNLQIVRKDRADRDLPFRRSGRGETGKRSGSNVPDFGKDSVLIRIEQIFDVNRNGEIQGDRGGFQDEETEKPKRIRIEGPPGIGKSIQCRKLACDWSSDSFQQFDLTFLLQMHHLSSNVKDAIFSQLLPEDTDIDREGLWSYIRQTANQPKVLFILDGLDELKPQVRQTSDVIKLIQQRVMTDATVVVTSRPHECTADLKGCPLHCNITGYTMTNSFEYIHKYFSGRPHLANSLWVKIARDKNLVELATNPLNAMLLCIVWDDNGGSLPSTTTGLFSSLVLCIVKLYCSKNDIAVKGAAIPENVHGELVELGRIAWEGLLRNEVNFDEADFKSMDKGTEMLKLGFLMKDLGASRIEALFVWTFLHKAFQEYIAAVFLSKDATMQAVFGGSVTMVKSTYIPPQLFLVEPSVSRQQANGSLTAPGPSFEDRVLQLLKDDNFHQVFLFLVGILKSKARAVFECIHSHLQVLRRSDADAAWNEYKLLFRFSIKCLIESENGSDLVRVLTPCFPNAIDVSDLFGHVYDDTWSSSLRFILDAQCPSVTRVDMDLSTHEMDKELAEAFIRNRFVAHLSITNLYLDDVVVPSLDNVKEDFPLFEVLKRAQSTKVFYARIQGITTNDKEVRLIRRLLHVMSQSTHLSSALLKLHIRKTSTDCTGKLQLPVDLLAPLSTLTTVKLWIYGAFRHHATTNVSYEMGDSGYGIRRFGEIDDRFEYFFSQSVDDNAFNESIGRLLCESKTIKTFSLHMVYRCVVFEHAKNLPSILARVISSTEVLRNIELHFSFYHKQRDLRNPLTYRELTRLHVFGLVEALVHNKTLGKFELFIDDDDDNDDDDDDGGGDGDDMTKNDAFTEMEEDVNDERTSTTYSLFPNSADEPTAGNACANDVRSRGSWAGPAILDDADSDTVTVRNVGGTPQHCKGERNSSNKDVEADPNKRPSQQWQSRSSQRHSPCSISCTETDQVRFWPSIASVFQNNTVLHTLNLTFKYCLTDSPESVQRMENAILALSGNRTLHTVKLAVMLYRSTVSSHVDLNASVNGIGNVDEVFHALRNVVCRNTTLRCLHFRKADDPWRRARRELHSFTELVQSDETWYVTVSKPAVVQLALATQRNMVLREFSVSGFSCEDEGVQELVDEIVSSARYDFDITFSIP
uniref:NACHT domain-containing protein n=1 Tax=Branchiostoma floridae TaxID=7739 RepID=C3Z6U4_BRAFL|eukprot:XP_002595528.1 hypothetical protein BRAFLDRAFT_69066 [Branchiostoma floridae]